MLGSSANIIRHSFATLFCGENMKVSATWKCIFGSVEGGKILGQIEFRSVRQAKRTHATHIIKSAKEWA